jgi:predicted ATP-grasp superfamily ATP-dependent carboligase
MFEIRDLEKDSAGAVIIGNDFQALGTVRSLAENGVPIFLVEIELGISRYSRYIKRFRKNYSLLQEENFADVLVNLAKKENLEGWVLFPNNDETVKLLSLNKKKLDEWFRNPVPSWEKVEKFYYKKNAYDIAEKISIPIPKMYRGEDLDEIMKQKLEFPVVLKPSCKENYYSWTKKKAVKARNQEEMVKEFNKMASIIHPSRIIVQEMIEGGPANLYSYATFFDGEKALAGISGRRLRQHPMDFGHATTYAESVIIPELEELGTKFLREIGYYGLAEVEFMKDNKNDCFKFIEMNGRVWGWHTLAKAAGLNLPFMLFQNMLGNGIGKVEPVEGVKWMRLITDIPTVIGELMGGRMKLSEYFDCFRGQKEFAVFSVKDPLPFIMEFIVALYLWKKRGF